MTWVKLEDTFPDHPKVLAVGEEAAWLFVVGLCYAGKHLTDGFIPDAALPKLTMKRKPEVLVERLVAERMWERIDGGWRIHDYTDVQRTRGQVEAERDAARKRQSRRRHAVTTGEGDDVSRRDNGRSHGEVRLPEVETETENIKSSSASSMATCHVDEKAVAVVLERYADLQHQRTGGPRSNPAGWRSTVIAQARADHLERIRTWLDTFDVTPDRIAAALVDGRAPADWNHHRKASAS